MQAQRAPAQRRSSQTQGPLPCPMEAQQNRPRRGWEEPSGFAPSSVEPPALTAGHPQLSFPRVPRGSDPPDSDGQLSPLRPPALQKSSHRARNHYTPCGDKWLLLGSNARTSMPTIPESTGPLRVTSERPLRGAHGRQPHVTQSVASRLVGTSIPPEP